jgi:hypothetical protein
VGIECQAATVSDVHGRDGISGGAADPREISAEEDAASRGRRLDRVHGSVRRRIPTTNATPADRDCCKTAPTLTSDAVERAGNVERPAVPRECERLDGSGSGRSLFPRSREVRITPESPRQQLSANGIDSRETLTPFAVDSRKAAAEEERSAANRQGSNTTSADRNLPRPVELTVYA